MSISLIECPECEAVVPPGRLSCHECGALLASVAGRPVPTHRRVERQVEPTLIDLPVEATGSTQSTAPATFEVSEALVTSKTPGAPIPALAAVAPAKSSDGRRSTTAAKSQAATTRRRGRAAAAAVLAPAAAAEAEAAPSVTPVEADILTPDPADTDAIEAVRAAVAAYAAAAARVETPAPVEATTPTPLQALEPATIAPDVPVVAASATATASTTVVGSAATTTEMRGTDDEHSEATPTLEPDDATPTLEPDDAPMLLPRPYAVAHEVPGRSSAAYRPPDLAFATAGAGRADWPGVTTRGGASMAPPSTAADGSPAASADATIVPDAARFLQIAGWFVVVGSAMALLGFLLPWSRTVIGARGFGTYFDAWGLASPTHVLVAIGLMAVLALGIVRTPVPAWVTTGILGLAIGGLLVGLAWPYIVGPLGADVGVLIVCLGGVALVVGGVLGTWASRHPEAAPTV